MGTLKYFDGDSGEWKYLAAGKEGPQGPPGPAVTPQWGGITGDIDTQTDLSAKLASKEPVLTAGTTAQYYRGDKSWQTLDKDAVGLSNVDNTSDTTKNSATATLTNKRVVPRTRNETTAASGLIPDAATEDLISVSAQDSSLSVSAPTGTPNEGQKILIRLRDDGTARAITWGAAYRAIGVALPFTTKAGKTIYAGAIYNAIDSKWDVIAVTEEL